MRNRRSFSTRSRSWSGIQHDTVSHYGGPLSGLWELYFENSFRILYSVDQSEEKVFIREIRHKDDF